MYVPPYTIKKVNSIIYNFIWRNKTHYVKKSQLVKERNKGGLKTLDFEAMVGVFKINWVKACLTKSECIWFHIPKNIFKKVGGLEFLLKCDFEITKLPIKLSEFHRQVLHCWKMIFSHNFAPHCSTLWNNRTITINRKALLRKNWFEKDIVFVADLMDENSQLLEYNTFKDKYKLQCSYREYDRTCRAITLPLMQMIQNSLIHSEVHMVLPALKVEQMPLGDKKCNNKTLGRIL